MIEVKAIEKKFGTNVILDGVDIQFPKGKITSLIGSNGAGKSTLLSIISRLLPQDKGTVLLEEKDIKKINDRHLAKHISILKQFNHTNQRLTVEELVSFGRFPHSQGKLDEEDREKIEQALDFLALKNLRDEFIDELSGGQRQRAYMAMIVAQDTEYILLDEPLNNLDMKHSVQFMKMMRRLTTELGKTVLVVLHDINFASRYSDYIIALKHGKIKYFDKTHNIIKADLLKEVFDLDFEVYEYHNCKICNYF